MLGAIAGDVIGSVYESHPVKRRGFELFTPYPSWTEDTVMTVAVAQALLTGAPYAETFRALGREHPHAGYGGFFAHRLVTPGAGPYGSYGNGSAMIYTGHMTTLARGIPLTRPARGRSPKPSSVC